MESILNRSHNAGEGEGRGSVGAPPVSARGVSVVIIAQDEEERIAEAIRSCAGFADEVVLVDGGSRDRTREIAAALGCTVYENPWPGYAEQRNFGAGKALHPWILFLDADESVGEDLARAIREWKIDPQVREEGFEIKRVGDFLGRWMDAEWLVRLYDRRLHRVGDRVLHETVDVSRDKLGRLDGTLWHRGFRSVSEHERRFGRYTDLEVQQALADGRSFSLPRLLLRPPARFVERYVLRGLWRKGVAGLAVALIWFNYEVMKELKLYERTRRRKNDEVRRQAADT